MRRGSFRRRLPRGRRGLRINPALLGVVLFIILLVPAFLYLFPHDAASSISPDTEQSSDPQISSASRFSSASQSPSENPQTSPLPSKTDEPVLVVTSSDGGLEATVNASQQLSQICIENTGRSAFSRVEVEGDGRSLGILSKLLPGEKRMLAISGPVETVTVKALDSSGREVHGAVRYSGRPVHADTGRDIRLGTKSASVGSAGFGVCSGGSGGGGSAASDREENPPASQDSVSPKGHGSPEISLEITTNKSEGREGDVVGFRCTAQNRGELELSDVRIFCNGKLASTGFLTPGKELSLEGTLTVQNSTRLEAGVQGKDAHDKLYTNNTTVAIWKITPGIRLEVSAPSRVHRGENIPLEVKVGNTGSENLTNLTVSDCFGEIGRIDLLQPSTFRALHSYRKMDASVEDEVRALGRDACGRDVYTSTLQKVHVLNCSLEIDGQPAELMAYAGEQSEVTWVLNNTGEEGLENITISGDGQRGTLKELLPGKSVRVAAIYTRDHTSLINVTAEGSDAGGYKASAKGCVLIKTVRPGISLKIMPSELEVCPGEAAEISCLITNTGDDDLTDVVLSQDGSALASVDELAPGEFKVVDTQTAIPANTTLNFQAEGKDSRGQAWSDRACANVTATVSSLRVFARASPPSVAPGSSANITCTVSNTGSIPLYSVFVISKEFGPIGNIDFLPPKRQRTVSSEKAVAEASDDSITAEGFTQEKQPVRAFCNLHISVMQQIALQKKDQEDPLKGSPHQHERKSVPIEEKNLSCGNLSMPIGLPSEKETTHIASQKITDGMDSTASRSNNEALDGIANLLRYVEMVLARLGQRADSGGGEAAPQAGEKTANTHDYELSIASVKGSEHGAIRILDVSASPSQPAALEAVKVSAHIKSTNGIKSAAAQWGLSDSPLTKQNMMDVSRTEEASLRLESGDSMDGYWSCTIPGKTAGTYMVLSVDVDDGVSTAEDGPFLLHWSTVNSAEQGVQSHIVTPSGEGMLFIESSSVKGKGEIAIKDDFEGSAMCYNEKMKGNGSISLESMRSIDRKNPMSSFNEQKDLVFTGGVLNGRQTVESPTFDGGMGAAVTERFNLSHVDKSETSSISSINSANNSLAFNTDQAFEGTWNIQTQYSRFYKKIKADQQYTGSFQTQKRIKFQDDGRD